MGAQKIDTTRTWSLASQVMVSISTVAVSTGEARDPAKRDPAKPAPALVRRGGQQSRGHASGQGRQESSCARAQTA
jgi:hypothetical protein